MNIQIHEILNVDQPQDMVLIFCTEGIARMAGLTDGFQVLVHRFFYIEADDFLTGHHDFLGQTVGKIKDVANEFAFHRVYFAFFVAGRDEHADFIFRMSHIDFIGHVEIAVFEKSLPQPVAKDDEGVKQAAGRVKEMADPFQSSFGPLQANRFGDQFAKNPQADADQENDTDIQDTDSPERYPSVQHGKCLIQYIKYDSSRGHTGNHHAQLSHAEENSRFFIQF